MERTYTVREMFDALRRRRWLAMWVGASVLLVAGAVICALPPEYQAESMMQIEPHQVPPDFFPTSITSFEDRMRTLKHGLLARPVLERVLETTDFYPGWRKNPNVAIEKLRRDVEVRLEGEVAGGPPALLFVVEVRGPDRAKVAKAADIIPRTYAELTHKVLQAQSVNLRVTLAEQLADLSKQLEAEEAKLVAFKSRYSSETPEANESNLRSLSNLGSQIDLRLAELADARRRRTALIASLPEPTSGAGFAAGDAADVLRRLQTARAAYGPDHPDVKRLERQYLDASARDAEELKRFQRDRLDTQSERLDAEIREQEQAIRDLKSQSAAIQRRLDAAPRVAEEYRARSRDYETIRAKYTTTLARASDARAAEALLAADSPLLFRVVESAALPSTPAGPNRLDLMLAALAAALGAGLLAVACAEYFDSSLRGPQDADSFGVSVLASIPRIGPARVFVPR